MVTYVVAVERRRLLRLLDLKHLLNLSYEPRGCLNT